jgi:hypothetical protein
MDPARPTAKLSDHPWIGLFMSLAMGVILIGGGSYIWASQSRSERAQKRALLELTTGVKPPEPDPAQEAMDWKRDMIAGASVGAALWVCGLVFLVVQIWKERRSPGHGT